jgi:uncharacterized protein (TIGR02246 family)
MVRAVIDDLLENWLAAIKTKDANGLAALVTEDCVFLASGSAPILGRQKLKEAYVNLFQRYDVEQKVHFEEIQSASDWAFGWGTDEITVRPVAGGAPVHFAGHSVSILRREPDGVWRFARGINNAIQQKS